MTRIIINNEKSQTISWYKPIGCRFNLNKYQNKHIGFENGVDGSPSKMASTIT